MTANQGLLRIFFALLLVAIIMFTSNYMVFRNSISGIYNEVKENNQLVVKNIIRSFDESFKDVNDIIFSINVLPYRAIDGSGNLDMHSVYMLQKQIGTVISANNYIEDVVLFYKGADLAITSTGTIDLSELIGQKYNNRTYSAAYWKSTALNKHPQKIYPADYYSARNGPSRKLLVVLSNNQVADQNIMVFMDADKLLRQANQEAMMEGTSLLVLDEERNAVLNTEDSWDLVQLLNDMNRGVGPDGTVQRKDYEYTFYRSDFNGFLYINKAPYQFANLQSVASANRTIMGIAIGIAILLSILLSRYLYKPVSQIVKLVGGRERGTADFGTILAGVGRLQKENERLKEQLELDRADMRRDAFLQALDGVPLSRTKELRTQQSFSEFFQEKGFVLASFQLRPEPGGKALWIRWKSSPKQLKPGSEAG
ncbi:hypothetical protein N6H14_08530 [Paenibacillus sp. CC-CFT747]|nr:hypothetical protein N6H14_08530 [Paenibacillus sp. CC-CFT747]